ncbi:MAG: hypothetical protein HUU35_11715 [Armatimonadetes bacterium]|nr:hypothetical protein [Armatimonadota bacterium]
MLSVLATGLAGLLLALVCTPLTRTLATRRGWVCQPRADRWSTRPVALLGGIAITGATLAAILPLAARLGAAEWWLLGLSFSQFVLGAVDDRRHLRPHTKLLGQVLAAVALTGAGFHFGFPAAGWDQAVTVLWLVGVANAFNLLDNMDGLCAGIAAIAATFLTIIHVGDQQWSAALLTAALAGACLGYLRYNAHPASIFMGDCGSLFIGFYLAGASLLTPGHGAGRSTLSVVSLPALVMLAPLVDTTFVTIARKLARRPISQGGRDHTSHRLVAVGLSEPQAVRFLYLLGVAGGLVALAVRYLHWYLSTLLLPLLLFAVGALGCVLGRVRVYEANDSAPPRGTAIPMLAQHRYRRRMAEVLIDTLAVATAFYIANILRYEGGLASPAYLKAFQGALPVVMGCHLLAYHLSGVYGGLWRYTSVTDLPRFLRAVTVGMLLTLASLFAAGQLVGMSRSLFAINWLVQFGFLAGSRVSLKMLHDSLVAAASGGEVRVLAVGVSEQAELALRRLKADPKIHVVGLVSEDPAAAGLRLLDTPIIAATGEIGEFLESHHIDEVVLLDPSFPGGAWEALQQAAAAAGKPVQIVRYSVERVESRPSQLGLVSGD